MLKTFRDSTIYLLLFLSISLFLVGAADASFFSGVTRGQLSSGANGRGVDLVKNATRRAGVYADLSALVGSAGKTVTVEGRSTAGDGGGGLFRWVSGDQSALVTGDPAQGLYVAPSTDTSGASGVWSRVFAGFVDLAWYGAAPSATPTENVTAFSGALNSGFPILAVGGGVYLVNGTLPINSGLHFVGDITIKQDGSFTASAKSTSYAGVSYDNYPLFYGAGVSDVEIVGITFDGNESGWVLGAGSSSLVMLENSSDVLFDNCAFINNEGNNPTLEGGAIFLHGGSDHTFINCNLNNINGEGVHTRANNTRVYGGRFEDSTSSLIGSQIIGGVSGVHGSGLIVDGAEITGPTGGAAISANHNDAVITNNTIKNTTIGVILGHRTSYAKRTPANNAIVSGNTIYNSVKAGVQLQYGSGMVVSDNTIDTVTGTDVTNDAGILAVSWCGGGIVANNVIKNAAQGFRGSVDVSDVDETVSPSWSITGNRIENILGYGIRVQQASGAVRISDNVLTDINTSAVSTRGAIYCLWDFALMNVALDTDVVIDSNQITGTDPQRVVTVSLSNQPDAVVRHIVRDNSSHGSTSGYVYAPPSLVLSHDNSEAGVKLD